MLIRAADFHKKMKSFYYDSFSRRTKTTNYANGRELESVTTYHDDGSVAAVGEITAGGTNTTSYSVRQTVAEKPGAYRITVTDPQGKQIVNYYFGDGQLYRSEGATYPNATVFDSAGRMSQLHTWRDESGNSDITRWHYDPYTGAVTSKVYADGKGTEYTYLNDGRMVTREWARGVITTYGYSDTATGSTRITDYSDITPSITSTYNLVGQLMKVEDGSGTTTFGYDSKGRQVAETNALAVITRSYDTYGRYSQFVLNPAYPGYPCLTIQYGYDVFNRLNTISAIVGSETNTFTYSYLPGTQLVSGYIVSSSGTTNLSVSRSYELYRNLISSITNAWNFSVVSSFNYSNDSTGKRTSRIDYFNGSTVTNTFDYNIRDEVTNAVMNSDEHSIVYDDIGNREQSTVYSGHFTVTNIYTANQVNQYTAITGGMSAAPAHDDDGNMTWDGQKWHHTYDGENRLTSSKPDYWDTTNGACMFEYGYNHKNLRVEKVKKQLSGREAGFPMNPGANPGTWNPIETHKYIWDGFNIAAEIIIDHVTPATNINYYKWGIDLSETLQGAGGVGGLLSDTKVSNSGTNTYLAVGDANGNITEYVDITGVTKAHYEYNSAGEVTYQSGAKADDFTHRFSTKPFDSETGFVVYQRRYYEPILCMWLSRDPIGEKGGNNLYLIANNDTINYWDYVGYDWRIDRNPEKGYAIAVPTSQSDSFDSLAIKIKLDAEDYQEWAHTSDQRPVRCKKYKIPNTVFFHHGKIKLRDHLPTLLYAFREMDNMKIQQLRSEGLFKIITRDNVSDSDIKTALSDRYIYQ
ncbi:MAG: hypothetical protein PHY48_12325 [Candidatus Cloacimonetes bacterium]|nr:hypothetical protein [Candidatus Cloacimonadota bacterium]